MDVKKWLGDNVTMRREENEVRNYKGYGCTLATVGLVAGVITGIVAIILQMVMNGSDSTQTVLDIISYTLVVALISYMIWLLLPMYKNADISVTQKTITTIIALASLMVPFFAGVFLVLLVCVAIVAVVTIFVLLKIAKPSDTVKKKDSDEGYDTIPGECGNIYGTRIDNDTFSGGGGTYKRTYEGMVEVWKEESEC